MIESVEKEDIRKIHNSVKEMGFALLHTRIGDIEIENIKEFIDKYPCELSEINYAGTEKRIWKSEDMNQHIFNFMEFSDRIINEVFGAQANSKTVLAYSNHPISQNNRLMTGRWHLDSIRAQYKIFCFLTRTESSTGPLELIPGTHKLGFKAFSLISGRLIKSSDLISSTRAYQQLDDEWVLGQSLKFGGSVPLICEAGSIFLVNTSSIHRARPCLENNRYALCAYYDHF
jgi:hypothetical protein